MNFGLFAWILYGCAILYLLYNERWCDRISKTQKITVPSRTVIVAFISFVQGLCFDTAINACTHIFPNSSETSFIAAQWIFIIVVCLLFLWMYLVTRSEEKKGKQRTKIR